MAEDAQALATFEENWASLRVIIKLVINGDSLGREQWTNGFSKVYKMCTGHPSANNKLYVVTKAFLAEHVRGLLFNKIQAFEPENDLLHRYCFEWINYGAGLRHVNTVYSFLNEAIKRENDALVDVRYGQYDRVEFEKAEIAEVGYDVWRECVIEQVGAQMVKVMQNEIKLERYFQQPFDVRRMHVVNEVVDSFVEVYKHKSDRLTYYEQQLEAPMLADTAEFYAMKAQMLFENCTVSQFLEQVVVVQEEEERRYGIYLNFSSLRLFRDEFYKYFIAEYIDYFFSTYNEMLSQLNLKDLHNLYSVIRTKPQEIQERMLPNFYEYVQMQALIALEQINIKNQPKEFIEAALNVHTKYAAIIRTAFFGNMQFVSMLEKACTAVIHGVAKYQNSMSCLAGHAAKYADAHLRNIILFNDNAEEQLNKCIIFFKYVEDKDIYLQFYAKCMAERLIYHNNVNIEAEEYMTEQLKQACGFSYVSKLQRMLSDMQFNEQLNINFKDTLQQKKISLTIMNASVMILQCCAWPLDKHIDRHSEFRLPMELLQFNTAFENFYVNCHKGRKLNWLHELGRGELHLLYLKNKYIVCMSTYQMAICVLFEHKNSLTCEEIQDKLQLPMTIVQQYLQSLFLCKILLTEKGVLQVDTIITINKNFHHVNKKFKAPAIKQETSNVLEKNCKTAIEDRIMFLKAAIVRILKARKVIEHNALIEALEVFAKDRFKPQIRTIKSCLEELIKKEFIKRSENTINTYEYVA